MKNIEMWSMEMKWTWYKINKKNIKIAMQIN
jgi:hypothetical protein